MIRGIYTSATGMVTQMARQDLVANNLANVNTTGFKAERVSSASFESILLNAYDAQGTRQVGPLGLGVMINPSYADFSNGVFNITGNKADLAIAGDALFTVETQRGERYTRAGKFFINEENYLVTTDGLKVLGEKGPLQLKGDFKVLATGEVVQGNTTVDRLKLVSATGAEKEGQNLYTLNQVLPATEFRIEQGSLEQSNVNAIQQMLEMVNLTRSYETNQKALTAHDETLGKVVNELSR